MILSAWIEQFRNLRQSEVNERTASNYEATLAYMIEFMQGKTELKNVTRARCDDFRAWLRHKQIAPTVCSHVSRAAAVFERAKVRGLVEQNPFDGLVKAPPKPVKNCRLTAEEIAKIIETAPTPDWKRLIGLCAYAGLRRGEALRVLSQDVDVKRRRINVVPPVRYETTKQRAREVILEPELLALLDLEAMAADSDLCLTLTVPTDLNQKMIGRFQNGKWLDGIVQRAGLKPFDRPFHTLRKWRINSWLEKGVPPWVVVMWAGHSEEVSQDHYRYVPESFYSQAGAIP